MSFAIHALQRPTPSPHHLSILTHTASIEQFHSEDSFVKAVHSVNNNISWPESTVDDSSSVAATLLVSLPGSSLSGSDHQTATSFLSRGFEAFVTKQPFLLCVAAAILHLLLVPGEPAEQHELQRVQTSEPPLVRRLGKCFSAVFQHRWPPSALRTKSNSPPVRISLLRGVSGSNPVTEWTRVMSWVPGLQISPSDCSSAWRFLRAETRRCGQIRPNLGERRQLKQLYQ